MKLCFILCFLLFINKTIAVVVTGQTTFDVDINGEPSTLTVADVTASANDDVLDIKVGDNTTSKPHTLDPTWTFFGLNPGIEYPIDNWDSSTNCGCFKQSCGKDCKQGVQCDNNNDKVSKEPWACFPWEEKSRQYYCWSVYSQGRNTYSSYYLSLITVIALTSYGGPNYEFVSPGFTIKSSYQNQNYSYNAMITGFTPRKKVDLSTYRYAESEGRVILLEELNKINTPPTISVNLDKSYCKSDSYYLDHSLILNSLNEKDRANFHSYVILRKADTPKLTTLLDRDILTPQGIQEWGENDVKMDIIDPCNQQFLTIKKDQMGNFFVDVPPGQRLNADNIICIAVNDVMTTQYDLVLYEIKNGGSIWSASNRFAGILSKDYLDDIQLRITTKSTLKFSVINANVDIDFNTEIEPLLMTVTTSAPLTCQIYLSPNCTFNITTTKQYLYANQPVGDCGYFFETGGYSCGGIFGSFNPPSNLVRVPISDFYENTTILQSKDEKMAAVGTPRSSPSDPFTILSDFGHWLVDWSPGSIFGKITTIFTGIIVILCICCAASIWGKIKTVKSVLPFGSSGKIYEAAAVSSPRPQETTNFTPSPLGKKGKDKERLVSNLKHVPFDDEEISYG